MKDQEERTVYDVFLITDREPRRRWLTHRIGDSPRCTLQGDAYTVDEALEYVFGLHEQIDHVIVDLGMEGGLAFQVIAALSSNPSTPPILAVGESSGDPREDARSVFIAGAMGYLQAEEVDEMLDEAIRQIQVGKMVPGPVVNELDEEG